MPRSWVWFSVCTCAAGFGPERRQEETCRHGRTAGHGARHRRHRRGASAMGYSDEHVVAFERGGDGAIRGITMGEAESFASRPGFKVLAALPERHRHVAHQGGISGCIVLSQKLEADEPWHVLH